MFKWLLGLGFCLVSLGAIAQESGKEFLANLQKDDGDIAIGTTTRPQLIHDFSRTFLTEKATIESVSVKKKANNIVESISVEFTANGKRRTALVCNYWSKRILATLVEAAEDRETQVQLLLKDLKIPGAKCIESAAIYTR